MLRITTQILLMLMLTACLSAENPAAKDKSTDNEPASNKSAYKRFPYNQNDDYLIEKAYQHLEKQCGYDDSINVRSIYEVSRVSSYKGGNISVGFILKINGIRVRSAFRHVTFNSAGKITGEGGSIYEYLGAKNIDTTPSISKEQAINIAVNHSESLHPKAPPAHTKNVELQIAKIKDKFYLVWYMGVLHGRPFAGINAYHYYIDAKTGEILKNESAIVY